MAAYIDMSEQLIQAVGECGAIISGHFVFSSGRHSDAIFDAGAVINKADDRLAGWIAAEMISGITGQIDTVIGVASKGNDLARWCALLLTDVQSRPVVNLVKTTKTIGRHFQCSDALYGMWGLYKKRVLVVEDVVTSGETVKKVIALAREKCAEVVGVSVLCSHGGVTAERLGVPEFHAATMIPFNTYPPVQCPMCRDWGYDSVRTDFGHGQRFLDELREKGILSA
jgi:orotate phosphoribosyltransferase